MAKKSTSLSLIVFGVLFIALGVFLFTAQSGTAVVIIVAALDALFGIALMVSGFKGMSAASVQSAIDRMGVEDQDDRELLEDQDDYRQETTNARNADPAEYFADEKLDEDIADDTVPRVDLAAREGELRAAAKQAAEQAARAKKVATDAINEAKQAEAELRQAESELAQLSAVEQHAAMRHIDALAQVAAEKSEIAVRESHKAKLAIKEAREAAELHSRAMDAAAEAAAADDEFAEFN